MESPEILQVLHKMQKDTSRLLFEALVSECETMRMAVAQADLALGDAASLVRGQLRESQGSDQACVANGHDGRYCQATSQRSTRVTQKSAAARRFAVASMESVIREPSGDPEDGLPDDEYSVSLGRSNWKYLDTVRHPGSRLRCRSA